MASSSKRQRSNFSAEEVANILDTSMENDDEDFDSDVSGMSSSEEFNLDEELLGGQSPDEESSNNEGDLPVECEDNTNEDGNYYPTGNDESQSSLSLAETSPIEKAPVTSRRRPRGRSCGRSRGGRSRGARSRGGRSRGGRSRGGRPSVHTRGSARATTGATEVSPAEKSYNTPDMGNVLPQFAPRRQPGIHLQTTLLRNAMTTAVEFFRLIFTVEIIGKICKHTNTYAWKMITSKPYYAKKDGSWEETCPEEIERLIAIIIYFGLVNVSTSHRYWSVKSLYHGLWARRIMSRERYKALMAMLHIVDPNSEDPQDKLRKVSSFVDMIKNNCKMLYQPFQQVSIDERMVKSKHRSGIRQYIKNKPNKWGLKLWVLADSSNGYTIDFDVYIGKVAGQIIGENGLGYDVVMKLMAPLAGQGYQLFVDNFYSSPILFNDLFELKIPSTGTITENRRGFPDCMKRGKEWAKRKDRGDMRWERDGKCLAMQWKDNRVVTVLTTISNANQHVKVTRKVKDADGKWTKDNNVKQPKAIDLYNQFMNGVDRSDQILAKNNSLRKCIKWWKTLFFHMIDIAVVNSHIIFQCHRKDNPDKEELKRPNKYSFLEYREEIVRQVVGLNEYGQPPAYEKAKKDPSSFETEHMLAFSASRCNCKVCYAKDGVERKVASYCSAPQCGVFLHCNAKNNCFEIWHKQSYDHGRK